MCVMSEFPGREPDQCVFHFSRSFAWSDPRAVGDAENVCVDGYCRLAEDCVQYHVRSFATHARKFFERLAGARDYAAVFVGDRRRCRDHVLRFGFPEADRADVLREPSTPSSAIACGVRATGNSLRVAAFTLLSVACAERITATSNSNGVLYSSSVVGCGFAARNRSKISRRLADSWPRFMAPAARRVSSPPACGAFRGAARHAFVVRLVTGT